MSTISQSRLVPEPFCIISTDASQENPNKLFLGGIPPQATEKQLEEFFSQFGEVKDVRIVTDRITAECKGYGFVTFDEKEDIEHLVERKTIRMSGKKIRIRKAIRRNGSQFDNIPPTKSHSNSITESNAGSIPVSPVIEQSAPIMIPSDSYSSKPLPPYSMPMSHSATSPPPDDLYEHHQQQQLSLSNFSSSQMMMSPMPDIELHNQQCGMQVPMSPMYHQNYQVIYVPSVQPTFQGPNSNWVCY